MRLLHSLPSKIFCLIIFILNFSFNDKNNFCMTLSVVFNFVRNNFFLQMYCDLHDFTYTRLISSSKKSKFGYYLYNLFLYTTNVMGL